MTVIDDVDESRCRILENIEIVAQEVGLHQRLLLGHERELDDLLAHQLVVLLRGLDEVGEVLGRRGLQLGMRQAAVAALAVFMLFRKDRSTTKDEAVLEAHSNGITYAPSDQGEERELYFLTDLGTMKFGHRIEDADRRVLYEAKVTKYAALKDIEMEFIDHVHGISETHFVGHEVNTEYGSMLADSHSTFDYDGEDIWAHLRRNGVSVESSFKPGKILAPQYRIFRNGEEIAFAESCNANVHEEDEAAKSKLASAFASRYFFRIWTREKNVELIFITLMAFARSSANDDEGGNFGLLFGKK